MFFSIIIPVYNVCQYLDKCITSVLDQKFDDYEIVLVDDGSTDNTKEIYNKYINVCNLRVICQRNQGVSVARNTGISNSKGEYVIFLDGDDFFISPDSLSSLYDKIIDFNFPDFLYNNAVSVLKGTGKVVKKIFPHNFSKFEKVVGEDALLDWIKSTEDFPWSVWGNVYKRSCIIQNEIYFISDITLGEDADWLFKFILSSNSNKLINNFYYCYRADRVGSAMNKQTYKNLSSYLIIVNYWLRYSENFNNKELVIVLQDRLISNYKRYFKYISFFNEIEKAKISTQIEESHFFQFDNVQSLKRYQLIYKMFGFRPIYVYENIVFRAKSALKSIYHTFLF